jgi:hypothetical protein
MKIGGIHIGYLSGPVSFALLVPNEDKISKLLSGHVPPPLMLYGDIHYSKEDTCSLEKTYDFSTIENPWFKLLDQVSSYEHPIDYFIEVAMKPKKLRELWRKYINKNDQGYNTYKRDLYLELLETNSAMHYIPEHHLDCFNQESNLCFTKNIRYHAIDPRFAKYDSSCIEYELNFNLRYVLNLQNKTYKIDQIDLYSLLYKACVDWSKGFSESLIDLIFKHPNNSCIWKQVQKARSNHVPLFNWKQWCVNYYNYSYNYLNQVEPEFLEYQKIIKSMIKTLDQEVEKKHKWCNDTGIYSDIVPTRDFYKRSDQEEEVINAFCTRVFSPLLDLYFLLRLWKQVDITVQSRNANPAWLTVLNAGQAHTERIFHYLIFTSKLYKLHPNCDGVSGMTRHEFVHKLYEPVKLRCLKLCVFDLDSINPNKKQIEKMKTRLEVLGYNILTYMLSGNKVYAHEIEAVVKEYCSKHSNKTVDKIMNQLDFSRIF